MQEHEPSIEYLELFAVLATVLNWLERFRNQRIVLFCDNQAVVSVINNNTSSCPNCLTLIRLLVLHSMKMNTRVFATYITSKNNKNADLLSRLKIDEFRRRNPGADLQPTAINESIWLLNKLWVH